MAVYYRRHPDEDVKFWAEVYTQLDVSLTEIEEAYAVSHSTVWWCFVHRLPYIDYELYQVTMKMIKDHRHRHRSGKRKEVAAL